MDFVFEEFFGEFCHDKALVDYSEAIELVTWQVSQVYKTRAKLYDKLGGKAKAAKDRWLAAQKTVRPAEALLFDTPKPLK